MRPSLSLKLALSTGLAFLALVGPTTTRAQQPILPNAEEQKDLSAYRVDVDVFGWSRDFREVAGVGSEATRFLDGRIRGEAFLLVYPMGATKPRENVQITTITAPSMPHQPEPLYPAKKYFGKLGFTFPKMWPRRPWVKRPKGGMEMEVLWTSVERRPGVCSPAVGLTVRFAKQIRYIPHRIFAFEASCALLTLKDTRFYWGKKDIAAAAPGFSYTPDPSHEQSVRVLLTAGWSNARVLKIGLRSSLPKPLTQKLRKRLAKLGSVKMLSGSPMDEGTVVNSSLNAKYLGDQLVKELGGRVGVTGTEGTLDIMVEAAPKETQVNANPSRLDTPQPSFRVPPPRRRRGEKPAGAYIKDFRP